MGAICLHHRSLRAPSTNLLMVMRKTKKMMKAIQNKANRAATIAIITFLLIIIIVIMRGGRKTPTQPPKARAARCTITVLPIGGSRSSIVTLTPIRKRATKCVHWTRSSELKRGTAESQSRQRRWPNAFSFPTPVPPHLSLFSPLRKTSSIRHHCPPALPPLPHAFARRWPVPPSQPRGRNEQAPMEEAMR